MSAPPSMEAQAASAFLLLFSLVGLLGLGVGAYVMYNEPGPVGRAPLAMGAVMAFAMGALAALAALGAPVFDPAVPVRSTLPLAGMRRLTRTFCLLLAISAVAGSLSCSHRSSLRQRPSRRRSPTARTGQASATTHMLG